MNAATRVAVFGAGLAAAFGLAFGAGQVVGPDRMPGAESASHVASEGSGHRDTTGETAHGDTTHDDGANGGAANGDGGDHGEHGAGAPGAGSPAATGPAGLQVAERGYRLVLDHSSAVAGTDTNVLFRILGPDNKPVTGYTRAHDKDLHLIAVRRDLTGFQHVHPVLGADGAWSTQLDLTAGSWRVFADFDPSGDAAPMTLGQDLHVAGSFAPQALPGVSTSAETDRYTVGLKGTLSPGKDSALTLSVSRDGRPVADLQPYLAAYGHLVALREGDLAYLHVHSDGAPGDGRTKAGPDIVFHTKAPSAGRYRLFLDFQHAGVVRTAAFTMSAGQVAPTHGH